MDEMSLVLDGNACGGLLRELFLHDMTAANVACAGCGSVAPLGGQRLYDYPDGPGAILRCRTCQNVLMAIVHGGGRYRVAASGMLWMEVAEVE